MRASRLLSILILLQLRGRLTAEYLAEEFEVSVRTIYRDIDALSAAGIPVYGDSGPGGGFRLLEGYRTKLTGLDSDETEAMLLVGLPSAAQIERATSFSLPCPAQAAMKQAGLPGCSILILRTGIVRLARRLSLPGSRAPCLIGSCLL